MTIGRDDNGRPLRRTRTRRSRADAAACLRLLLNEIDAGGAPSSGSITVGQLLERWLSDHVELNTESTTANSYRRTVTNHVTTKIGDVKLKQFSAMHVTRWIADLERSGVGSGARRYAFRVLSTAMNYAISPLQLIGKNPCDLVDSPKHAKKKINPFTVEESLLILDETTTDPLHAAYVLALQHGLRYGEVFGLPPHNVDFKKGLLHVRQQLRTLNGESPAFVEPKSESSIRTIELTPRSAEALNDRRKILLSEGNADSPVLLTGNRGGIMWPQSFYRYYWTPLLKRLGITPRGFHHTRHTFATLALGAGEPVHIVSAILGHSSAKMTLDMYAHYMPTDQQRVTATMSRLLG